MLTAREPSVKPLADVVRCYICCDGQHKSGNTRHFSHLPSRIKWAGKAANPLYHTFRQKDTGDAKSRTFLQRKGSPSYNLSVSLRSTRPGCGSQRLLRCRSHPAGRGPNSSSLFPPLAAVVAVAPSRGASGETVHFAGPAKASPSGGAGAKRLRGRTRELSRLRRD